jgi:hypothetical protein
MKRSKKLQAAWDLDEFIDKFPTCWSESQLSELVERLQDIEWPYTWPKSVRVSEQPPCPWQKLDGRRVLYTHQVLQAFRSKLTSDEWSRRLVELLSFTCRRQTSWMASCRVLVWFGQDEMRALENVGLLEAIAQHMASFEEWTEEVLRYNNFFENPSVLLKFLCDNHQQLGIRVNLYTKLIRCWKPEFRKRRLCWIKSVMQHEAYTTFLEDLVTTS